jgi:hypothetical protein
MPSADAIRIPVSVVNTGPYQCIDRGRPPHRILDGSFSIVINQGAMEQQMLLAK